MPERCVFSRVPIFPAFAFWEKMKAFALHFFLNRSPRSGSEPEGLKGGKK
jgi:hypothetical protein